MRVALIARSTLHQIPGGDTVQVRQTAAALNDLGITAVIKLAADVVDYQDFDLLHFFNIARPADILRHIQNSGKPYVVSTILFDHSEYDKHYRKGVGFLFNHLSGDAIEYLKTVARCLKGKDKLVSWAYLWKGQYKSIVQVITGAAMLLPNSVSEYRRLAGRYCKNNYHVVPNGIDPQLFNQQQEIKKDDSLVVCAARIEGVKNQLNLIKALNNTRFHLVLIGNYAPNQYGYYQECRKIASPNVEFISHLPQAELLQYYQKAKVHVLPSWFETTGLSSVEAATMGCNIVITEKGDTREYFEDHAFYCDPASPQSVLGAIEKASTAKFNEALRQKILNNYTWQQAAIQTLHAYQKTIGS
jgi:glycosyltransferase involved in cell wall biosynthesis